MPVHPCMQVCIVMFVTLPSAFSSSMEKDFSSSTRPPISRRKSLKSSSRSAMYSSDCSFVGGRVLTQWNGEISSSVKVFFAT